MGWPGRLSQGAVCRHYDLLIWADSHKVLQYLREECEWEKVGGLLSMLGRLRERLSA
ncbi:hypothetical protein [Pseudomonas sp. PSE14]|uniref:hypothetical protein n=1 Tax=Pseudomonas sp. PSE14 TaxID=3016341 RepID=UPI0023D87E06|nr:hypothetical protein [Pseudomonas sp. PSE14]WEJ74055.1 hypothetical protein O6P39_09350 [Pseudomonas sp. PSE14]